MKLHYLPLNNKKELQSSDYLWSSFNFAWVRTVRDSKTFGFIEVHDGTFFKSVQGVFEDSMENFDEFAKLGVGAAILVTVELVLTTNQKQPFEITAAAI